MIDLDNYKNKVKSEKNHEVDDFSDKNAIEKIANDDAQLLMKSVVDRIKEFDVSSSDIKFDDAVQHAIEIDHDNNIDIIIRDMPSKINKYKYAIGNVCSNPECNVTGDSIELHHVMPVSEGGSDKYDNFIMLCHDCHMNGKGVFDLHGSWQHNYEQLHEWKENTESLVARQYGVDDVSIDELIRKIISAKNTVSVNNRPDIKDLSEYKISDKFNTWADYQADIVDKIVNSDKKYFVLRAPPGSGKSLIAIVAGLELRLKTFYVVHNKQLQHQIINDFSFICEAKGRNNFICKASSYGDSCDPGYNCGCGKGKFCEYLKSCDYKCQYNIASEHNFVCWNYAYFLQIMNSDIMHKFDPDLIILDEAHLIDSALSGYVKFDISEKKLNIYDIHFPSDGGDAIEWLQYVLDEALEKYDDYKYIAGILENSETIDKNAIRDNNKHIKALESIINKASNVIKYSNTKWVVGEYSEAEPGEKTTFESYNEVRHLVFTPVWANELSGLLLGHASKYILMSATISEMNLNNLGIEDDDIEFIDMPSTFDPKRMPIKYMPYKSRIRKKVRHINRYTTSDMMSDGTIIDKVDSIIEHYPDHKGVIHTANYQITEHIISESEYSDRMISHLKYYCDLVDSYDASVFSNRNDAINEFMDSDEPKILVSPSVETGLDLPGDLGRWQMITKIPYANIGDKVIGIRIKDNEDWYIQDTIDRVVQATGRICRSISDHGITYILDPDIEKLILKHNDMFPEWWLNSLSKVLKNKIPI